MKNQIAEDRLSIISAGVAFYGLLASLPALGALISIYGLLFDPRQVMDQISAMRGFMPGEAVDLLVSSSPSWRAPTARPSASAWPAA